MVGVEPTLPSAVSHSLNSSESAQEQQVEVQSKRQLTPNEAAIEETAVLHHQPSVRECLVAFSNGLHCSCDTVGKSKSKQNTNN